MAESKPVQPFSDRATMHCHSLHGSQFGHDLIEGKLTLDRQPIPHPSAEGGALAVRMVSLRLRQQASALAFKDHDIVHEPWRHPKVPRRLMMPMTFFNERDNAAPQLDRMWLPHSDPQYLAGSRNHKILRLGILNHMRGDML